MITVFCKQTVIVLFVVFCWFSKKDQPDKTIARKATAAYPTIENIGIEWEIEGDKNENGRVHVLFREAGAEAWKKGMNLFRVPKGENLGYSWKNKHAGSIFNLNPCTTYEILLRLIDPDGGSTTTMIRVTTRSIPTIKNAHIIELTSGSYDTLFTTSGTKFRPVLYRCLNGEAVFTHIDMQNKEWVYLDGLTVINKSPDGTAIKLNGSVNCAVMNCTINAAFGIVAYVPGIVNCYISDNIIKGITPWTYEALGAQGANIGEGIEITGSGNVICYNQVSGFRDCISFMEGENAVTQKDNDIYNNEISAGSDDGIEADFSSANCRIYRNRLTDCYVGLSSQPCLGGPSYFIRNAMYNIVHSAFKLKRYSQGDVILHNTVIKLGVGLGGNSKMNYAFFRNNLAIGGPTGNVDWGNYSSGNPYAADIIEPGNKSSFDYDAVGVYGTPYLAKINGLPFSVIEKHGIENITLQNTFDSIYFPFPPFPGYKQQSLIPKRGSPVEDKALILPNINDNFSGKAPDCGAYEIGYPLPHYGPRKNKPLSN